MEKEGVSITKNRAGNRNKAESPLYISVIFIKVDTGFKRVQVQFKARGRKDPTTKRPSTAPLFWWFVGMQQHAYSNVGSSCWRLEILHEQMGVKRIDVLVIFQYFPLGGKNSFSFLLHLRKKKKQRKKEKKVDAGVCSQSTQLVEEVQEMHPPACTSLNIARNISEWPLPLWLPSSHPLPAQGEKLSSNVTAKAEAFPLLHLRLLFYCCAGRVSWNHSSSPVQSCPYHKHTLALKACSLEWKRGHIMWLWGKVCSLFLLLPLTQTDWNHFWFHFMHKCTRWDGIFSLSLPLKCRKI